MVIQNENICREKWNSFQSLISGWLSACLIKKKKKERILSVPERTGEMPRFSTFPVWQTGWHRHKTEFEISCGFKFIFWCACFSCCMDFFVILLRSIKSITCALLQIVCVLMAQIPSSVLHLNMNRDPALIHSYWSNSL